MLVPSFVIGAVSIVMLVLGTSVVSGQDYPSKPIRIICNEPGGAGDFFARTVSPGLSALLGQPVIVENRGGTVPIEAVSKGLPDGYSLLIDANSFWIAPLLRKTSYDPVKDFSLITLMAFSPNVLVVNPSLPVKSVKELVALAKAKPGELNYGSGQAGSAGHLSTELFKTMAGISIVRITYRSGGPRLTALIGGEVQLNFDTAASVAQHIKSGRVRALAVTSAKPSALFPDLPTIAASGFPGYESVYMQGMWVAAGTPATTINRLNQSIVRVLNSAEVKEKLFNAGSETIPSSPGEAAAKINSEIAKWGKVIKDVGIKAD